MAETKYGKYFITYEGEQNFPAGKIISRLDDTVVKGSFFYFLHWVMPNPDFDFGIGHPPHIHKDAELLFHIGTNPEDPTDLGAEVELFMGREMERYVITKSCVVFIPPNFIHCPWKPIKTYRPWIFLEVNQGPRHTEKGFHQLLPKEVRDKVDLSFFKDEGF